MTTDLFGVETKPKRAMGSHEAPTGGTDEWLTPPELIKALGTFDLDPCSPINRPWPTARNHFTIEDNGISKPWAGRVWLNPPYANPGAWMSKLADHGTGTALLFARTETLMWHRDVWPRARAVLFIRGRLYFHSVDGRRAPMNAGAPSALIAYGHEDAEALRVSSIDGGWVDLKRDRKWTQVDTPFGDFS